MTGFSFPSFRMQRSGWGLLAVCAVIGVWLSGWQLGVLVGALLVVSLLVHELGHTAVASLRGVRVFEVGLIFGGAYIRREQALGAWDELAIAVSGPATNLVLGFALICLPVIGHALAFGNLALCFINLLPLPASDGLRILRLLQRIEAESIRGRLSARQPSAQI